MSHINTTCDFSVQEKYAVLTNKSRLPFVKLDLTNVKFNILDMYISAYHSFIPINWNSISEDMIDELFDKHIINSNLSSRFNCLADIYEMQDIELELIIPIIHKGIELSYDFKNMYIWIQEYPITNAQRDNCSKYLNKYQTSGRMIGLSEVGRLHRDEENIETIGSFFY